MRSLPVRPQIIHAYRFFTQIGQLLPAEDRRDHLADTFGRHANLLGKSTELSRRERLHLKLSRDRAHLVAHRDAQLADLGVDVVDLPKQGQGRLDVVRRRRPDPHEGRLVLRERPDPDRPAVAEDAVVAIAILLDITEAEVALDAALHVMLQRIGPAHASSPSSPYCVCPPKTAASCGPFSCATSEISSHTQSRASRSIADPKSSPATTTLRSIQKARRCERRPFSVLMAS